MYVKLIIRNLKRSMKEYSIYMMTLIITIMLMYAYNGVVFSGQITKLASEMEILQPLTIMLSVVIVMILGWLVYYIANFILQKRSREFGMYQLLGMTPAQVSRMFILEQLCLGMVAFLIGCFLGIFAFQIIQAIIMGLFEVNYIFEITFSPYGFVLTLLYFIIIYAIELMRERRALKRRNIYDMLQIDKQNEVVCNTKKISFFYFLSGILCMIIGMTFLNSYLLSMIANTQHNVMQFMGGVLLIGLSIYLLFFGLSATLLNFLDKRKNIKYHGNTMYLSSQIAGRLRTNRFVLATLFILSLLTIIFVCIGFKFSEASKKSIDMYVPFDIMASSMNKIKTDVITDYLKEHNIGYKDNQYTVYDIKNDDNVLMEALKGGQGYNSKDSTRYLRYNDYKSLMELKGKMALTMPNDGYIVLTTNEYKNKLEKFAKQHSIYGLKYIGVECEEIGQTMHSTFLIIVPDAFVKEKGEVLSYTYNVKTYVPSVAKWRSDTVDKYFADNQNNSASIYENEYHVRAKWIEENTFSYVVINFCLLYLAIIFLCISATILSIQQLSDVRKQTYAYHMLMKMGLSKKEIYKLLRKQIAIYFFLPLIIPCIYLVPISFMINHVFQATIASKPLLPYLTLSILCFFFIYICYYGIAYFDSKRNINIE